MGDLDDHVEINVEEIVRVKSSATQVVPLSSSPLYEQQQEDEEEQQVESVDHHQPEGPDDWLPITESRKGNAWSSTYLLLSSGIGLQAFLLPVALVSLGWYWGIITLTVAFVWQLYTIWLLVDLHESVPPGTRYSRYLYLAETAFGVKLGKLLALFPVLYSAGGTCALLVINGGSTLKLLYQTMCGDKCATDQPLSGVEWCLIFVFMAILVAQFFPNLHSVAKVSIVGAITAVGYCTLLWILSVVKDRPDGISHHPQAAPSDKSGVFGVLNALGFIAFAFRGHNLVLEIQGTLPSGQKFRSKRPMQKGVTLSYLMIASCFFPLAIAGYWSYGNKLVSPGGILRSYMNFHGHSTPKSVKGLIYLLVVINYVAVFQAYAMVVFDNLERLYVTKKNMRCPRWLRSGIRVTFGGVVYFVAVAVPFLGSLAPIIGGITTLPLTFAYPCFMWIAIRKPRRSSTMWCLNFGVGCLGIVLSVLVVVAAIRTLAVQGLKANFFDP